MWKIIIGFVAFAALALFVLMKSGGDIDMSGEKHGAETQAVRRCGEGRLHQRARRDPCKKLPPVDDQRHAPLTETGYQISLQH